MKKLMYIVFFLLTAANLLAQESYVIDSVCEGAERTYRRDGEANYSYYWELVDRQINDTSNVPGVDFIDINGTDTTWGNEITHLWDAVGEFDIVVYVTSEHGCDTLEQGMVKVFPLPESVAGEDQVLCDLSDIAVSGDTAWNHSVLYWTTTGDGTFSDAYSLHPVYELGHNDSILGEVTLILTAEGLADNGTCTPAVDSVTFRLSKPDIEFEVRELLCYNDRDAIIRANMLGGAPPFDFAWTGPDGYTSTDADSITGLGAGMYYLTVTDANGCFDIDSVEIINPPELLASIKNVTQISCYGYSDGMITASASGGTGALSFSWASGLGATFTGDSITGLPADTYYLTVTDENGCMDYDTVVLPEPELLLVDVTADDTILCEGEVVMLHGNPVGGTGELTHRWTGNGSVFLSSTTDSVITFAGAPVGNYIFTYTITDEALCEATDSIELNVYPPSYSYDSLEVCAGADPFDWNHRIISSDMDRTYLDTLPGMNQYGCDSFLTLDVKVLFPVDFDTTIYVCENETPFALYNQTILPGRDSIYLDTAYYSNSGCDSLYVTINVFTLPLTDTLMEMTFCSGADEFQLNNRWIQTDSSQVYLDTLYNANQFGCDSLLTYDVTIIPPDTFYTDTTFCQGEPEFVWNGITILTAFDSIYEATLTNRFGCDSLVQMDVRLLPVTDTVIDTMLCYNTPPYAWNNLVIYAEYDSTYLDTLVNQYGCDSLLTLNVNVIYPDTINLDTTLCEGTPEFAWGVNTIHQVDSYNDSIYTDILQNQFGCDSIVNLDARILRPAYILDTIEICENEPAFVWHSLDILSDRDSIYSDTLYYEAGCDSLRLQLTLISHPISDTIIDTTLCEGSPEFVWNSHTVSTYTDSTYLDTLTNIYGCDSTIALNVDIVPAFKDTLTEAFCFGEPIADWNGQNISSEFDSTYIHNVPGPSGCDTLIFYEVTILPVTDTVLDSTICYGLPEFYWNNRLISTTADDIYLDTLVNRFGCDSLLTYNVIVLPPDTVRMDTILCVGTPEYDWNGYMISTTEEKIYEATLQTNLGCDSIVILTTKLIEGGVSYDTVYACVEYTWTETGKTYTETGDDYRILGTGTACPDTSWLHVVISNPVIEATPTDVLCYGDSTGAIDLLVSGGIEPYRYLWNTGDTTASLSNLPAGDYSVKVTDSLADSLACEQTITVTISQPDPLTIDNALITDVEVTGDSTGSIEVDVFGGIEEYRYVWTDATGAVVDTLQDLLNVPAGTYTLTVTDANDCETSETYPIVEPEITPCIDDTILTCYEDLADYPLITSLADYLASLKPEQEITLNPGCEMDTASFTADSLIVSNSIYCYEEIRFYFLLDNCGDTLFNCTQSVIVNDPEAPVIDCPKDFSVSNGIVPDAYDSIGFLTAGGSFSDNCGIVRFELIDEQTDTLSDHVLVTRTYEVQDYCGNVAQCPHEIKVYSDVEIDIVCDNLDKVYYECSINNVPRYKDENDFWDAGGRYSSSVPIDTFFYSDNIIGNYCPTVERTFTIRNEAGLEATCTQVFQVLDEEAPILNLPDVHIYCNESLPRRYSGSPSDVVRDYPSSKYDIDTIIWDNCGRSSIDNISPAKQDDVEEGCPRIITRYYNISDKCGNRNQGTQRIYIYDTIPPEVTNFPYELTAECDIPPAYTDVSAYVSDDCGAIEIAYRDSLAGADQPGVVYRIYTFTDGCNPINVIQKITIELTNVPVLAAIAPVCQFSAAPALPTTSVNGITGTWLPDSINTTESGIFEYIFYPDSGQCAGPASLTVEVVPAIELTATPVDQGYNPNPVGSIDLAIAGGSGTFDINWSGPGGYTETTEDIFNLYAGQYIVEVRDDVGCYDSLSVALIEKLPEISCPPDTMIECPDPAVYPPATNIAEFEALGGSYEPRSLVADFSGFELPGDRDFCLSIDRYYVIEDIYGRIDTCVQHVDFYDTVPPVIIAPPGDTAECLSAVIPHIETFADFMAMNGADAYDPNCALDPASFTVRDTAIVLGSGGSQVIYYFSISDFCGNTAYDTSYYLVTDDQAPEVYCADITVYLNVAGGYSLTVQDSITLVDSIYDNCTAPEDMMVYIEMRDLNCTDIESGSQARIVVVDEAGLSGECTANITVVDTIPPEAICQDITVYLDENGEVTITAAQINNTSTDNCEIASYQLSKDHFDCYDVGDNTVELTVTDIYGNSATCEAVVTVVDQIPPVITCVGKQTVQLSEEDGTYTLSWEIVTESADDECGIDTILLDKYVLNCEDIGTTFITVTAYDVNGNSSSCQAEFEVFGNIPPNVVNDTAVTAVDIPVDINVVLNDYDLKTNINISSLGVTVNPNHGSVVVDNTTGIVTYTPNPGYVGPDVFRYSICDDGIPCEPECGKALVFITVRPANQPPVAVDDYYDLPCGNLTGNVALNDYDPDGDNIVVNPVTIVPPVNGILTLYDDGHFEYEPFFDFEEGVDSFQYEIWDEGLPPELRDTAWVYITRVADHDCDGVADVDDIDDDNDGIRDVNEGFNPDFPELSIDSDQDGIPDYLDIDSDNDGIVDNIEGQGEHDYVEPDGWRDQNNDGWDDRYDPNYGGYPFDENLNDHDGDGVPDFRDIDSDNDNVPDFIEGHDDNADGIPDVTRLFIDSDGDGLDDAYDTWIDTWGNDIDNEIEHNAPLQDFDGDGWRDWRDTNDEDDEFMTIDEDINGDGDYSNDDLDLDGHPEYLDTEMDCELFIPEGFSPNDDGVHDFFQILCIYPRYPNAKMMIFNRNGQKLWEKEHYGNYDIWGWNDAWWWGTTDSRFVIGRSGGLPAGNYIYVLELNDGLGGVRNGTVMLAY